MAAPTGEIELDNQLTRSELLNAQLKKAGIRMETDARRYTWLGQGSDTLDVIFRVPSQVEGVYHSEAEKRRHDVYHGGPDGGFADAEKTRWEAWKDMQALPEAIRPGENDLVVKSLEVSTGQANPYVAFSDDYLKRVEIWSKEEAKRLEGVRIAKEEENKRAAAERAAKEKLEAPKPVAPPPREVSTPKPVEKNVTPSSLPKPPVQPTVLPPLPIPDIAPPQMPQDLMQIPKEFIQHNTPPVTSQRQPHLNPITARFAAKAKPDPQASTEADDTAAAMAMAMRNKDPKTVALLLKAYNDTHDLPPNMKRVNELAIQNFNTMSPEDAAKAAQLMGSGNVQSVTHVINLAASAQLYSQSGGASLSSNVRTNMMDYSDTPGGAAVPGMPGGRVKT